MAGPALVVMSRVPSPDGKSRLGGIMKPEQRERLQWAFLLDALDKFGLSAEIKCFVAATPAGQIGKLAESIGTSVEIIPQVEGDLGQRMLAVAREMFYRGHAPQLLIGADVPAMSWAYLLKALDMLKQVQLVLGPTTDGGYYLIGMIEPERRLFEGISWGTDRVMRETLAVCNRYHFKYDLLEPLRDIDLPGDLEAALKQLNEMRSLLQPGPRRTLEFLNKFLKNL